MSKKNTAKKTTAIFLTLATAVGVAGCNFIVADAERDMAQTVATVNVSEQLKKDDELRGVSTDVQTLIDKGYLSASIPKRDLVASFLTAGITYVQSYGYTYTDTFNMLMDGLVNRKMLTQYVVAYKLSNTDKYDVTLDGCMTYVNDAITAEEANQDKTLYNIYNANREYLALKYFLTEGKSGEENMRAYNEAEYTLRYSINSSLDSAEANYVTTEDDTHTHDTTRTTPTNANVKSSEYYPISGDSIDYQVYTGRNDATDCGEYETIDGSTKTSRKKAYNAFLTNLQSYGLIGENEDTADVTKLNYYYFELTNTLGQKLISEYAEELEETAISNYTDEEAAADYARLLAAQEQTYSTDATAFDTALDSVSDRSFVLYGLDGFGFVYNILLPFSASQNLAYTAAKNKFGDDQEAIYKAREEILNGVKATDLREAWFCADNEDEHYAYKTEDDKYLFFKNTTDTKDEYEKLSHYLGQYPYNGTVTGGEGDEEYSFTPNKVGINDFIDIFTGYVETASGKTVSGAYGASYGGATNYIDGEDTNYDKFIYYSGKVNLEQTAAKDYFNRETDAYKALSAVNELMFAYSTDTACLNTYMGYVVAPDKTDFVPEFEYAAQKAVAGGVGSYVVVPSDYGWHIIYCSFVYGDGEVYGGYNAAEKEVEGTFSYTFYEALKANVASTTVTNKQNQILNDYKNSATLHTKAYQDLLDLDKQ